MFGRETIASYYCHPIILTSKYYKCCPRCKNRQREWEIMASHPCHPTISTSKHYKYCPRCRNGQREWEIIASHHCHPIILTLKHYKCCPRCKMAIWSLYIFPSHLCVFRRSTCLFSLTILKGISPPSSKLPWPTCTLQDWFIIFKPNYRSNYLRKFLILEEVTLEWMVLNSANCPGTQDLLLPKLGDYLTWIP